MKKIFMLLVILMSGSLLLAQQNYQDVVYLKNGSIIRGTIIEQVPNKSIKIETADNNVFVYQVDEIEKFSKETTRNRNKRNDYYHSSPERHHGLIRIADVGYTIGVGDYGYDFINLTIIHGYKFNPHFSLGFGTGARYYHATEAVLIPFFANFHVYFLDRAISPYVATNIGYSFDATDDFEPTGFLFSQSIGVHFGISDKLGINVSLGYEGQWADFYHYSSSSYRYSYSYRSEEFMSGISFKVGFVF